MNTMREKARRNETGDGLKVAINNELFKVVHVSQIVSPFKGLTLY